MWIRYFVVKLTHSIATAAKSYDKGQINEKQLGDRIWKNLFQGRLTFFHHVKGEQMAPTFKSQGETLLVRSVPLPSSRCIFIGDVVVFKDPQDTAQALVRRVAALEGDELVSTDEKDEPFTLEEGQCWVVSDNEALSSKEAYDSRTFGPLPMKNIFGRAIYCSHSAVDHGHVLNSSEAMHKDTPVVAVELDLEELRKQA
ncbi:hypothetical protein SELMODRAFT_272208 [Selaginella moellendorffii]|uniref:Peptidase S26 domain-containing protein n=1 Tax=Selaginella moellendorffii TaxID=88036 RepID=D8T794_SELML|nr:chloroplast processing peptidase [Selaginella moellendorffii]XP_002993851.1 chloroplast processing peptidase [Selaginella moellendorffii]EFJ05088.1 hypothetical protein SELMODRAFT_449242 [Selaginella moellendorffii]EFJ07524.1 hypothetical protein SELMODRAFT_272208 [Selaginella moellendorffii]|eukprot:XP_002991412.1 chloroplast processing peptidase [Selaginella moellendorffii]